MAINFLSFQRFETNSNLKGLTLKLTMLLALHYVKSVQMWSFFWSVFSWNSGDTSSVFVREGYLIFPNKKILRQNILFD